MLLYCPITHSFIPFLLLSQSRVFQGEDVQGCPGDVQGCGDVGWDVGVIWFYVHAKACSVGREGMRRDKEIGEKGV